MLTIIAINDDDDDYDDRIDFNGDNDDSFIPHFPFSKVIALYAYQPSRSDELDMEPQDIISVLYEDNENWWFGELPDGRQGYFPANYVMEQGNLRSLSLYTSVSRS